MIMALLDRPADAHGQERIQEFVLELALDDLLVFQVPLPQLLDDFRMQEQVVRHDDGAQQAHHQHDRSVGEGRGQPVPERGAQSTGTRCSS